MLKISEQEIQTILNVLGEVPAKLSFPAIQVLQGALARGKQTPASETSVDKTASTSETQDQA